MKNYLKIYLKNRPLFLSMIRSQEASMFDKKLPLTKPILDFGCGDGFFAKVVFGSIDTGVDVNKNPLDLAQKEKIYKRLLLSDGKKIPTFKKYSSVISNCVLEHVEFLDENLTEINRVLKPGGKFYCSVMTDKWEDYLFGRYFLGSYYKLWMRKKQVHRNLLSKSVWETKFKSAGFGVVNAQGYMGQSESKWLDALHYFSLHSLISYKLFGKWVVFPFVFDLIPVDKWLENIVKRNVSLNKAAAIFFELRKP